MSSLYGKIEDVATPRIITLKNGETLEAHRSDDPSVFGLLDIIHGRTPLVPTTVYKTSGDSASGVAGRVLSDSTFLPKSATNIGHARTIRALAEPDVYMETVWDGAAPARTFIDAEGKAHPEHTHGLLLGDVESREGFYINGRELSTDGQFYRATPALPAAA